MLPSVALCLGQYSYGKLLKHFKRYTETRTNKMRVLLGKGAEVPGQPELYSKGDIFNSVFYILKYVPKPLTECAPFSLLAGREPNKVP